jgi:hypothetical protein
MANLLIAGNANNLGTIISSDTSGIVQIKSGTSSASGNTAITIDINQNVTCANSVTCANTVSANVLSANTLSISGSFSANTISDSLGNLRAVPVQSKTSGYVLANTDAGQCISITSGGITATANVFTSGAVITIYNNSSTQQLINQGSGLTLQFAGLSTTGTRTIAQYGLATILYITPTYAIISGAGLN